jgi:hypothetical protein
MQLENFSADITYCTTGDFESNRAIKIMNKNVCIGCLIISSLLLSGTANGVPVNIGDSELPPSYELGPKIWLIDPESIKNHKEILELHKININDFNDLKRATASSEYPVRLCAYHILALQYGSQAIPILQDCLDKPDNSYKSEHTDIARYSALLGDKSSLKRLRDEITAVTKYDNEIDSQKVKSDPNKKESPPLGLKTKGARLSYCLEAAGVLAEFGDSFGYELAVKAVSDKSSNRKVNAAHILTNLSRLDKAEQKARGIDPEAALSSMLEHIESETDIEFVNVLIYSDVRNNMRPESQVKFFEKCQQAPNLSGSDKQRYSRIVERLTKQIDKEKQAKAQENKN